MFHKEERFNSGVHSTLEKRNRLAVTEILKESNICTVLKNLEGSSLAPTARFDEISLLHH